MREGLIPIADIFHWILSPDHLSTSGTVFETVTEARVKKLSKQPKLLKIVIFGSRTTRSALN